jgi:hypothetical protein
MTNWGKFLFRFYLLCCTTTFAYVRMKFNTNNNINKTDADQSMGTLYNTTLMSRLNKLVMEMCKPLFGSRRTFNMDNSYTSPDVLILLKNQKVYARGKVRNNRRMVPQCIVWTKKEAEDAVRGSLRWAVNTLAGIFAFGWTDGCPVHMIYMADGSHQRTTVLHQVGRDKNDVPAPNTVKAYNAYMQGVDQHDQLRALFSLTKRHGFKKRYVNMWLALINIAFTNASICYLLANPELKKKEGHRRRFFEEIANFLIAQGETFDWENQFGSQNNDVEVYQPDYDSDEEGVEDEESDDALLHDLGVKRSVQ